MASQVNLDDLRQKEEGYFEFARTEMMPFLPENAKTFLDVGCGGGTFGSNIKKAYPGCEVWGIELDEHAASFAEKKLDKVFVGDINEMLTKVPENYFDCISFNDVLEHLVDPFQMLRTIKSYFTDRGVLVASLPNIRDIAVLYELIFEKDWRYTEAGTLDKTHLRFFTGKSLRYTLENHEYEIVKMEGINRSDNIRHRIFNLCTLGFFSDTLYYQYAVQARPKK